jgi:hypothetical protein
MNNKVEYVKDTFDEYLSKSDYVSASDLKTFLKSPRAYFYDKNRTEPKPDKKHFAVGSALHEYIMEKDQFDKNFIVSPKFDRRTKDGKQKYEDFQLIANSKTIIDEQEMEMIKQISVGAKMNRTFMELLDGSHYEVSCYTFDEITGLKVRLRPDILPMSKNTVVDIKSCLDSSPRGFKSDVYSYGYSLTSAYYLDFLGRENYVFAAMEKNPPYQTSLYVLNDEMTDYGRHQYRMALDLLKWSIDNNYWCDYIEFEILKESYLLGDLTNVIDTIEKSELINILL